MSSHRLSIVIAAVNGAETLRSTLESIDRLPERDRIEVVLVETAETDCAGFAREAAGPLRVVRGSTEEGIPRLRYRGVVASSGDFVAIIEDHVDVAPDWASVIFETMADASVSAVGGRVEAGRTGWVDSGLFLADYARYVGPVPEGDHADLPGNNIAYRREALLQHAHALAEGKWESWVNDALAASGHRLISTNRMVVSHCKGFTLGEFLNLRWHFGRSYAGMRLDHLSPVSRMIHFAGSAALPAILTLRATKTLASRHVPKITLLKSWPLIALVMSVGAAGECVGYLLGPGRSLERVR
ncbi:glycosyltransferase [bacterium]|nr:glycosyltransferase [bacterium]